MGRLAIIYIWLMAEEERSAVLAKVLDGDVRKAQESRHRALATVREILGLIIDNAEEVQRIVDRSKVAGTVTWRTGKQANWLMEETKWQ